jgi:hypothetical protein
MNTPIKVVRYHLVNRVNYLVLPVAWLAFAFAVDLVIFALIPVNHQVLTAHGLVQVHDTAGRNAWGLIAIGAVFVAVGVQSISRSLPFALALGVSRRSYYAGTAITPGPRCSPPRSRSATGCCSPCFRPLSGAPAGGESPCTSSGCRTSSTGRGTSPG